MADTSINSESLSTAKVAAEPSIVVEEINNKLKHDNDANLLPEE